MVPWGGSPILNADNRDIRCPKCSRLLARFDPSTESVIVRYRDRIAVVLNDGSVSCTRCSISIDLPRAVVAQSDG